MDNIATITESTKTDIEQPQPPKPPDIGVLGQGQTLTDAQYIELLSCEEVLASGWKTFVEVGRALASIRDHKLYEAEFDTFEQYYRAKWHFEHSKVYHWIWAAEVTNNIAALKDEGVPRPDNEWQLRPLYPLSPEQRQSAWRNAAAKAAGRPITARLVKQAVVELNLPQPQDEAGKHALIKERTERRRLLRQSMTELLTLIMSKAAPDLLLQKATDVDGHIRFLFPET
jgi:hypothetical protein